MTSKIAVILQTCERHEYTARTLATFAHHNDLSRFTLLHGDDASSGRENRMLAASWGFSTVVATNTRIGWKATRRALVEIAAEQANWILVLENDIEWVRPFPWDLFDYARSSVSRFQCLRLYGVFKDAEQQQPCMTVHKQRRDRQVKWKRLRDAPEPAEAGEIHWSSQPSVTHRDPLLAHFRFAQEPRGLTVRVVENVTNHIGAIRTSDLPISSELTS